MRHRKAGRKLGRTAAPRRALMRNLVTSLIEHERITTTEPKAKEMRRFTERMITLGKRQTVAARRQARAFMMTDASVSRLFDEIAPRFQTRPGGYTRIVKLGRRTGDAAPLAMIELTESATVPAPAESDDAS